MARVKIVTDSTSDIPSNLAEELGIEVVPLNVHFGDKVYRDGIDLTNDQFYEMLTQSAELPKTSQPSAGDFDNVYSRYCDEDQSIASIHISSKLSGTLNSAQVARENFKLRCHIDLFDTLSTSMGLGLIAMNAARAANDGADRTEIADLVRKLINNVHIYFFVDTLEYLQKGGRIGRAQALLGSLLNIKPVLKLEEGEVHPVERVRTRSKALDRLVEFVELFPHIEEVAILHSTSPDDVNELVERVNPFYPREKVLIGQYGPVIGTHVGPGGICVIVSQGTEA